MRASARLLSQSLSLLKKAALVGSGASLADLLGQGCEGKATSAPRTANRAVAVGQGTTSVNMERLTT
jgi:hypothetical protein